MTDSRQPSCPSLSALLYRLPLSLFRDRCLHIGMRPNGMKTLPLHAQRSCQREAHFQVFVKPRFPAPDTASLRKLHRLTSR